MTKSNLVVTRKWAAITIKKFRSEMQRLKIHKKGELYSSFQAFVTEQAGGDIVKVRMLYLYYGKFVDQGVGRGRKFGKGDSKMVNKLLGSSPRQAKKWYSPVIAKETFILTQIVSANAGQKAVSVLDQITRSVIVEL